MKQSKLFLALAASLCCMVGTSQATVIIPGVSGVSLTPQAIGGTILATMTSPYLGDAPVGPPVELNGSVTSQVRQSDAANPFGPGFLSFYYKIANTPGGSEAVDRFTAAGFKGFSTAVAKAGSGTPVGLAYRSSGFGNTVGFDLNAMPAGTISEWVVIHTNSKFYGINNGGVSDGITANLPIYSAVPEPSTVIAGALLLLPFAASTMRRLRKNRTA